MRAVDVIQKKRDGHELTREEIAGFIDGYTRGSIPDYQASALAMAVFFKGMTAAETVALTESMMHTGEVLDLRELPGPKVDKHSTGGVGDKTSMVLAPLAAACGLYVPMISGRGLGHTGGTLDKLESIPGFRVGLSLDEFRAVLRKSHLGLIGQTPEIAPADRKLYALRDVTSTVESRPLIAASIMSKKMAEGIDALVLDVKTGDGAFMVKEEDSRALAEAMLAIGKGMGKKVVALITDMEQPLGRTVGNALEIVECIETLQGKGPEDLETLSVELAAWMLSLAGAPREPGRRARAGARGALVRRGPEEVPGGHRSPGRRSSRVRRRLAPAPRGGDGGAARGVGRTRDRHRLPGGGDGGHAAGGGPRDGGQPRRPRRGARAAQEGRGHGLRRRAAGHRARERPPAPGRSAGHAAPRPAHRSRSPAAAAARARGIAVG